MVSYVYGTYIHTYYQHSCVNNTFTFLIGGIVTVALDEEGLAEYAELFNEVLSLDGFLEHIVVGGTIPDSVLNACEISAYITSTGKQIFMFNTVAIADCYILHIYRQP